MDRETGRLGDPLFVGRPSRLRGTAAMQHDQETNLRASPPACSCSTARPRSDHVRGTAAPLDRPAFSGTSSHMRRAALLLAVLAVSCGSEPAPARPHSSAETDASPVHVTLIGTSD